MGPSTIVIEASRVHRRGNRNPVALVRPLLSRWAGPCSCEAPRSKPVRGQPETRVASSPTSPARSLSSPPPTHTVAVSIQRVVRLCCRRTLRLCDFDPQMTPWSSVLSSVRPPSVMSISPLSPNLRSLRCICVNTDGEGGSHLAFFPSSPHPHHHLWDHHSSRLRHSSPDNPPTTSLLSASCTARDSGVQPIPGPDIPESLERGSFSPYGPRPITHSPMTERCFVWRFVWSPKLRLWRQYVTDDTAPEVWCNSARAMGARGMT